MKNHPNKGMSGMIMEVLDNADLVAQKAASIIAVEARQAVASHGRFILAVSGGKTPWKMLRALAVEDIPWKVIHIVQVDERLAPEGHPDRNLTHLRESLLELSPLHPSQIHAMNMEAQDLEMAAMNYASTLRKIAGTPAVIDMVHLGLGADGHTASLIPGDPILDMQGIDVGMTGIYQGRRRMTLTYPIINRSGKILWLVTGHEKCEMLKRLCEGDVTIPAGRVTRDHALVLADRVAAESLKQNFSGGPSGSRDQQK
jgi:6-phosphogluconolactonase